jgi:RNA polymerase sigma factor for flagellar operon FliA
MAKSAPKSVPRTQVKKASAPAAKEAPKTRKETGAVNVRQAISKYQTQAKKGLSAASKAPAKSTVQTPTKSPVQATAKSPAKAPAKLAEKAPRQSGKGATRPHFVETPRGQGRVETLSLQAEEEVVTVEVDEAMEARVEAEARAREEAELQKELEAEIAREAVKTGAIVKEDFSPLNCDRDRLVKEYAPLIKYIAQKIASRLPANIEIDDLMSSGVIGLMDAIEKYDSKRDNKFKTYAEFRIRGAILDELRAQDWVPRSVREKAKMIERCYNKIEQLRGRQATDEEVCEELGISQEEYHLMLNQVRSVSLLSYDDISNFSKADKRALHGYSEHGPRSANPLSEVSSAALKRMISDAIRDLPEKQRLVLSLYYYEDLNLKEIGRVLDVTESRVSQLHTQAILRLKGKLRNHWDEFVGLMGGTP